MEVKDSGCEGIECEENKIIFGAVVGAVGGAGVIALAFYLIKKHLLSKGIKYEKPNLNTINTGSN